MLQANRYIKDRNNILAYTSQGLEIRIGSVDNIEVRMATLNDIINQVILSGIIEEPIEAIDIRYEKSPVVVLEGYSNIDVSEYVDDTEDDESIQEKNDRANSELETQENADANTESGTTEQNGTSEDAQTNQTDRIVTPIPQKINEAYYASERIQCGKVWRF